MSKQDLIDAVAEHADITFDVPCEVILRVLCQNPVSDHQRAVKCDRGVGDAWRVEGGYSVSFSRDHDQGWFAKHSFK